ncbi:hypothetical protein WG936_05400 [Corynebacterium sp. H127]|uniref:hypothetical protein n=1 Tax=Corynebacterium sp. H127 TaxID=3133418 RepID=UPI00309F4073
MANGIATEPERWVVVKKQNCWVSARIVTIKLGGSFAWERMDTHGTFKSAIERAADQAIRDYYGDWCEKDEDGWYVLADCAYPDLRTELRGIRKDPFTPFDDDRVLEEVRQRAFDVRATRDRIARKGQK